MCANNTSKKTKPDYTLPIVMLHALIINQCNFSIQYFAKHLLVLLLFFAGVRKKQISFTCNEIVYRHFFNTQENITFAHIFFYLYPTHLIFFIRKTAMVA